LKVLGLVGWSGSGKTTLLTALIPLFRDRGLKISTIKHAHHALELDRPGKDSYRHRHAGAEETILANSARFALFSEHRDAPEPDLGALVARLAPVDLVLVEGFKGYTFPKLEIFRPALGKPALWPEMSVMAVVSDAAVKDCAVPVLDLNAPEQVAYFIMARLGLHHAGVYQE
jgi:molybdopterin-guanine dinucleotide biosynthesis protein B